MRILHLICASGYSGLENVSAHILKEMSRDNEVCYAAPEGVGIETVKQMGINTAVCATKNKNDVLRLYNEYKPDVVHANDPHVCFTCAKAGIPFIAHLHNNYKWLRKLCPNSIALLYTCLRADKVICVSKSIPDEYIFAKLINKKTIVLENFVDADEVLESAAKAEISEKFDISCVCRMTEQKRPLLFLKMINCLKNKKPDVRAAIVGDGELMPQVKSEIEKLGLSDNVKLYGFVSNPHSIVAASEIGVLTSDFEGFGLVSIEAMILGKPFLAFPVGGLTKIINEENGHLCSSAEDMADEAYTLLCNRDLYNRKSAAAKELSKQFTDKEAYITKLTAIYKEFCKK